MSSNREKFLPVSRVEMNELGWKQLDILLVTGDAYVDHPSFGTALIGRCLQSQGYKVGIVAQPRWNTVDDVSSMGRPRLFVGISAGALDSMLAHYTAFRKKRSDDPYTPGGLAGARPNRACIVYANLVRQAFPGIPVVLGGIEASLRRASHYDFWTDALRRSILLDAKADIITYGMSEHSIRALAESAAASPDNWLKPENLLAIPGLTLSIPSSQRSLLDNYPVLYVPSHEDILAEPSKLMMATMQLEQSIHQGAQYVIQPVGNRLVVMTPPASSLSTQEMDAIYALPFTRLQHPSYTQPVPALDMIQFSITSHRGCGGGCSFCSLALHQTRHIQSRSRESIRQETQQLAQHPHWRGSITDVGGPSANMWGAQCQHGVRECRRSSCLYPSICPHFHVQPEQHLALLDALSAMTGVKHVRVASGIRHDLALRSPAYCRQIIQRYTGGQLKLAPEHASPHVLKGMRKPGFDMFCRFVELFQQQHKAVGHHQFIVPYLMSAFPGSTEKDMRTMIAWFRNHGWKPQQVQCFIPTPGTVATAMYHAQINEQGEPIYVAKSDADRLRQHQILVESFGKPPKAGGKRNS